MSRGGTVFRRAGKAIVHGVKVAAGLHLSDSKLTAMQKMPRGQLHSMAALPSEKKKNDNGFFKVDSSGIISTTEVVNGNTINRKYDPAGRLLRKDSKATVGWKEKKYSPPGRFIGKRLKGFED